MPRDGYFFEGPKILISEYQLYFVTPITRYIMGPCCNADDHVTNSGNPDFLCKILSDLTKLKFSLRKKLAPATVLDGIELICGSGCNKDRIEQILRSGWADLVHPKPHIYSKMALNLIEKVAAASIPTGGQKRKRSDSSEESHSRGGQGSNNRSPCNRGGSAVHSAPQPRGNNRAAKSGNSLHSHQSWNPPRGRGQYQGRGEARGRGFRGRARTWKQQGRAAASRVGAAMEPLVTLQESRLLMCHPGTRSVFKIGSSLLIYVVVV
jgi:hypothetical protein